MEFITIFTAQINSLLKEIIIAIRSYFRAYSLIRQHGSWKWTWIPGILYALMFAACIYLFYISSGSFSDYIIQHTYIKEWLQSSNQFLSFLFVTSAVMINLLVFILSFSIFRLLFQLICAPLFVYLSRRTYSYAEGDGKDSFSLSGLWGDVWRLWAVILKNALWQAVYFLALIIISLIPVVGWVTPLAGLLSECYYFGFPMIDLACMRKGTAMAPSANFISLHKGLAIGNGMVFYLLVAVPIAGWIVAPVYAVVAATLTAGYLKD